MCILHTALWPNQMKLIILFFACINIFAQTRDTSYYKNFAGGQIGGQLNIGVFYERSFLSKKNLSLNGQIGIGLNISSDSENDISGTYSLQQGCVLLIGLRPFFFEIGPFANLNKSGTHTFANLNSWVGIRLITQKSFFLGIGYTPIIYQTFTKNSNYGDTWLGIKFGGNF